MFLSSTPSEQGLHELDFRFEIFPERGQFLFAHHGAKLNELLEICGIENLGLLFYVLEVNYPFTIAGAIHDRTIFQDHYGVDPLVAHGRFLQMDSETLTKFFQNTGTDNELDCVIVGSHHPDVSEQELQGILDATKSQSSFIPLINPWQTCLIHTHDNHFLWFYGQNDNLLRTLIKSSLVGFFNHIHPHQYSPISNDLLDLIMSKYPIAPLVCIPTVWSATGEIPSAIQSAEKGIHALIETAESSWIAYKWNPPKELVGRGIMLSYYFDEESWSFQELQ